jgi:hypothetical protein
MQHLTWTSQPRFGACMALSKFCAGAWSDATRCEQKES